MKTFVICAALGLVCFLVIACSDKPPSTVGQAGQTDSEKEQASVATVEQSEGQTQAQEATSAQTEIAEIDGQLIQTEKGLAIATGTDAYVVAGMAEETTLESVFKGVTYFLPAYILCVIILMVFPEIIVFLPNFVQ